MATGDEDLREDPVDRGRGHPWRHKIVNLPRKGRMRRNTGHGGKRKHSNAEFAARSIGLRPKEILWRLVADHWEGDTAYSTSRGSRQCLLTLVERKTRMELILTKDNRTVLYFALPYCSCERGTNENGNGIIRRFLPKGTDFAFIKAKEVKEIQDWMNTYPRRILNGSTPLQSFKETFGLMDLNIKLLEACS